MQTVQTVQESADAKYRLAHTYFSRAQQAQTAAARDYWLGAANAQHLLATRADAKAKFLAVAA